MRNWFTKQDAIRMLSLNVSQQKMIRDKHKVKESPNPGDKLATRLGYSPREFLKMAVLSGHSVVMVNGVTIFAKQQKVFEEKMFNQSDLDKFDMLSQRSRMAG